MRRRRANETPEERVHRRSYNKEHMRLIRSMETKEETEKRRRANNERECHARAEAPALPMEFLSRLRIRNDGNAPKTSPAASAFIPAARKPLHAPKRKLTSAPIMTPLYLGNRACGNL